MPCGAGWACGRHSPSVPASQEQCPLPPAQAAAGPRPQSLQWGDGHMRAAWLLALQCPHGGVLPTARTNAHGSPLVHRRSWLPCRQAHILRTGREAGTAAGKATPAHPCRAGGPISAPQLPSRGYEEGGPAMRLLAPKPRQAFWLPWSLERPMCGWQCARVG